MPTRALIVGNWKMNGLGPGGLGLDGIALADALGARLSSGPPPRCELVLAPPATLIARVASALKGASIALAGQDCHAEPSGAHTGDVSAEMLKDAGCRYVIVGHSERRRDHGETDVAVRAKAAAAHRAGLIAILCVGESEAERTRGNAEAVVERQLRGSLPATANATNTVLAYEPVWAIGSRRTPSTAEIAAMHALARKALGARWADAAGARVLYGGSVKAANARQILGIPGVDGALVGGASLDATEFWAIAQSCP